MDEAELKQAAVLLCEHFGVRKPGMAALIVGQAKEFARSQREALEAQVEDQQKALRVFAGALLKEHNDSAKFLLDYHSSIRENQIARSVVEAEEVAG